MTHPRLSGPEAYALMRDREYVYLDVRTEEEFALGHPLGAYNVPWLYPSSAGTLVENPDFLATVRATLDLCRPLIVGCQSGNRSRAAAARLLAGGYHAVVEQRAGYEGIRDAFGRLTEKGWCQERLPTSTEPMPGRDHASLSAVRKAENTSSEVR